MARGLVDIALADRSFETDISSTAPAQPTNDPRRRWQRRPGDAQPLLNDEVFATFDAVIPGANGARKQLSSPSSASSDVKIVAAASKDRAEITLAFRRPIHLRDHDARAPSSKATASPSATSPTCGPSRATCSARDPNWMLVATSAIRLNPVRRRFAFPSFLRLLVLLFAELAGVVGWFLLPHKAGPVEALTLTPVSFGELPGWTRAIRRAALRRFADPASCSEAGPPAQNWALMPAAQPIGSRSAGLR